MNSGSAVQFDSEFPRTPNRHLEWLKMIVRWDGVLPLVIGAAAPFTNLALPNHDDLAMLVAVFLPIAGFLLRLHIGSRHFESHYHYAWQSVVFFIALFLLVLLDAVLILFNQIPGGVNGEDWRIWFLLYAGYVAMMAIALYPRLAAMPIPGSSQPLGERSNSSWN